MEGRPDSFFGQPQGKYIYIWACFEKKKLTRPDSARSCRSLRPRRWPGEGALTRFLLLLLLLFLLLLQLALFSACQFHISSVVLILLDIVLVILGIVIEIELLLTEVNDCEDAFEELREEGCAETSQGLGSTRTRIEMCVYICVCARVRVSFLVVSLMAPQPCKM